MKNNKSGKRVHVRIEILPQVMYELAIVVDRKGMTQVGVCSRLLEWFVRQPERVQTSILGLFPESDSDVTTAILNEFTDKP